jgi:serine/threonine-protein kinase
VTGGEKRRHSKTPRKRASHTRRAERGDIAKVERELARLRRENDLLRSQLRGVAAIPRRRGIVTPGSLSPTQIVADRYRLERLLAKGGMGAVWVARDLDTGIELALKLMREGAEHEEVLRFKREAMVCQRLCSEHVARVYDHGVDGGNHYIAMELLRGESLSSLMRRRGALSLPEAVQLTLDLRAALEPAHAAGIVHRDLKPQNLFLSVVEGADEGEPARVVLKLLDFGVAKDLAKPDDVTSSGAILGSPNYMSPEQAHGVSDIDHRSDLWSVGVILYRVLTGARPWEGNNSLELLLRICTESPPPPSRHRPGLPPAVDRFFVRALAHEPSARFESIDELAQAFVSAANCGSIPPPVARETHSPLPSSRDSLPTPVTLPRVPLVQRRPRPPSRSQVPPRRRALVLTLTALVVVAAALLLAWLIA